MKTPKLHRAALLPWVALTALLLACRADDGAIVIRLVDEFGAATVTGTPSPQENVERTEWLFEGPDLIWAAGAGIAELRSADGQLAGRSTTDVPILHVERQSGLDDRDVLEMVVVRARVSAGTNLAVTFSGQEKLNMERTLERVADRPWPLTTPLVVGEEVQTYTLRTAATARTSFPAASIRHVLLRPTDAVDADFEIDSVRLVFRQEHLATIPSGVSWQGLGEVYRESIVARAPEEMSFDVQLPSGPMLDLAIGTLAESPLTFRVTLQTADASPPQQLLERTLSTAHRWHPSPVDLREFAGRRVKLSLQLQAAEPGAIGLWGAPAIRNRQGRAAADGPRGVVVFLVDTLRRDHLDAYGYGRRTSPAVARLASEGTRFADAISQGAWTKVSVPSILSSTYPSANGIYEFAHRLPASADTLAEVFRDAGYATWSGSANSFSGKANNLHQGFEVLHERSSLEVPEASRSKTARSLADRLLPWLESHSDVPFFVFFHPIDPHNPYRPYRPYDTQWGAADGAAKYEEWSGKVRDLIEERSRNGRLPHREDLEEVGIDADAFNDLTLDWYDGSIRAADVEIQRTMEKLRELGVADDTLIVFLSDHGEEFLDHGGGFHEDNVYGELVNVPLILRWPGRVPAARVVEETVEMLDLAPTVLELAGIDVPEGMQGDSLVPLLGDADEGRRWGDRPAISEWTRRTDQRSKGGVDAVSIILGGYKLVHNVQRPDGVPEFELYDHHEDPRDQHDLAAEHPEIVERLAAQLESWRQWVESHRLPSDAEASEGLDAQELQRLRSLGYI